MKTRSYTEILLSGIMFILLIFPSEISAQTAEKYRNKAEQGEAWAQHNLAMCYYNGLGVKKDVAEAAKWYRRAAEQGTKDSQFALGSLYYMGIGVKKDAAEATKWHKKAAEQGHEGAQFSLGNQYKTEGDIQSAIYWYQKAADQNNPSAQKQLGFIYYNGKGIPKDYTKASMWLNKVLKNSRSDALDQYGVEEILIEIGDTDTAEAMTEELMYLLGLSSEPDKSSDRPVSSEKVNAVIPKSGYVDLGLSVKWATYNVGATTPKEYGGYYSWNAACKFNLPTKAQMQELIDKCNWEGGTLNGVKGMKVTGHNGNSIFLPCAGDRDDTSYDGQGEYGLYWSNSPDPENDAYAYHLNFDYDDDNDRDMDSDDRKGEFSVREVSKK